MNMTQKPTVTQLRTMLAKADDLAGHHILWVDKKGEVHLSLIPDQATPRGWSEHYGDRIQFRYETYERKSDYVGKAVAADAAYVQHLLENLVGDWVGGKTGCLG